MSRQYKSTKWTRIVILILVIIGGSAAPQLLLDRRSHGSARLRWWRKIGLLEDEDVKNLADAIVRIDYAKAGSWIWFGLT